MASTGQVTWKPLTRTYPGKNCMLKVLWLIWNTTPVWAVHMMRVWRLAILPYYHCNKSVWESLKKLWKYLPAAHVPTKFVVLLVDVCLPFTDHVKCSKEMCHLNLQLYPCNNLKTWKQNSQKYHHKVWNGAINNPSWKGALSSLSIVPSQKAPKWPKIITHRNWVHACLYA